MMKKILIIAIFLAGFSVAFAGNPIIVIRCGLNAVTATTSTSSASLFRAETICEDENTVSFGGHCYPLPVEGSCVGVVITGFDDLQLVPQYEASIDMTICVPDCSTRGSSTDVKSWSATQQECVCVDGGSEVFVEDTSLPSCGCPDGLEPAMSSAPGIVDGTGGCVAPQKECYNAGLTVNVEPFICDVESATSQEIKILLTKADNSPWLTTDAVTLADLENCDILNNTGDIVDLVNEDGAFGADARPAFVPIPDPTDPTKLIVEIVFTRDPSQPTEISFLGDMNDPITIPSCPRVFDPCSCRPENITDADGVVLFWYDELTFTGNPNEAITVADNSISPMGFLDNTQTPITAMTSIGTTDGNGLLTIPFFRAPGADTDVSLQDPNSQTARLQSSCSLSVNACNNAVPTMGEWSVIVLSLMMLILGLVSMKHKSGTLIPIKERVKK